MKRSGSLFSLEMGDLSFPQLSKYLAVNGNAFYHNQSINQPIHLYIIYLSAYPLLCLYSWWKTPTLPEKSCFIATLRNQKFVFNRTKKLRLYNWLMAEEGLECKCLNSRVLFIKSHNW